MAAVYYRFDVVRIIYACVFTCRKMTTTWSQPKDAVSMACDSLQPA